MVDVGTKAVTNREAEARGVVVMRPDTLTLVRDNAAKKGDVLGVARVAGIMAAKHTADLIPLCHPIALNSVAVDFSIDQESSQIEIVARARTDGKTGVEMEALTAVSVAALTIYDMCKSSDREMRIEAIRLTHKAGGKSGTFSAE